MTNRRTRVLVSGAAAWAMCLLLANAQSVTVRMEVHHLRGKALTELKELLAPIRTERTQLLLEHRSQLNAPSDAYS